MKRGIRMREIWGMSEVGNIKEAISKLTNSKPDALILMTTEEKLADHARELAEAFPGVPSIGAVGQSYANKKTNENGVTVVALCDGISAVANVIEELSLMPVKYIKRLEKDIQTVGAQPDNTVCFDFCTGHDSRLVTTLNATLEKKKISLVGGTSNSKAVAMNGKVYEDACVYLMLKNQRGKVKVYKENIYKPMQQHRMIATKTKPEKFEIIEIDGKSAEQVYRDTLHITREQAKTQTFKNPLGRCYGNEVYLISIKEANGSSLECYRQVNNMDILTLMELDDYKQVVKTTIEQMQKDLGKVSGILSVNCLFRFLFFSEENYWNSYLEEMCSISDHVGLVGVGEHYNKQHVNQTMCCVVFE